MKRIASTSLDNPTKKHAPEKTKHQVVQSLNLKKANLPIPAKPRVVRHLLTKEGGSWVDVFSLPKDLIPNSQELQELWDMHPVEKGQIVILGKLITTPRWQQSYGKPYKFSGMNHAALPIPPGIQKYLDYANTSNYCQGFGNSNFNMCLMNWYEDGSHYIGPHSDDERDMIKDTNNGTVVYSVSLGQNRRFHLNPKKNQNDAKSLKIDMPHGTVVVMGGLCQQTHKHSVPKVAGEKGSKMSFRINLTLQSSNNEKRTTKEIELTILNFHFLN